MEILFASRDMNYSTPPNRTPVQGIHQQKQQQQLKFKSVFPQYEMNSVAKQLSFSNCSQQKSSSKVQHQQIEEDLQLLNLASNSKKNLSNSKYQQQYKRYPKNKYSNVDDSYEEEGIQYQTNKKRKFEGISINLSSQFEAMSLEPQQEQSQIINNKQLLSPNSVQIHIGSEIQQQQEIDNLQDQFNHLFSQNSYEQPQQQQQILNKGNISRQNSGISNKNKGKPKQQQQKKSILKFR